MLHCSEHEFRNSGHYVITEIDSVFGRLDTF